MNLSVDLLATADLTYSVKVSAPLRLSEGFLNCVELGLFLLDQCFRGLTCSGSGAHLSCLMFTDEFLAVSELVICSALG